MDGCWGVEDEDGASRGGSGSWGVGRVDEGGKCDLGVGVVGGEVWVLKGWAGLGVGNLQMDMSTLYREVSITPCM